MSEERVQKLLARAGVASRRAVEEMMREGRVTVNGKTVEPGAKVDPARDHVKVDGKRIPLEAPSEPVYLLLHKPEGVMSTVNDPEGRTTVLDLVPQRYHKALVPVGRLDYHSSGLLLMTNDGDFAFRISHPRFGCSKSYEVKVKGEPAESQLDRLRGGILLDGRKTEPATIRRRPLPRGVRSEEHSWWQVELVEGRNRQIREMFQRIGHPVQRLRRVAIGPLADGRLPVGAYRELTSQEVESLRGATGKGKGKAAPAKRGKRAKPGSQASPGGKGRPRKPARPTKPARPGARPGGKPSKGKR